MNPLLPLLDHARKIKGLDKKGGYKKAVLLTQLSAKQPLFGLWKGTEGGRWTFFCPYRRGPFARVTNGNFPPSSLSEKHFLSSSSSRGDIPSSLSNSSKYHCSNRKGGEEVGGVRAFFKKVEKGVPAAINCLIEH